MIGSCLLIVDLGYYWSKYVRVEVLMVLYHGVLRVQSFIPSE